jgi:hypothetical protein
MARYSATSDAVTQFLTLPFSAGCAPDRCVFATPAYWNGTIYVAVSGGPLMAVALSGGLMPATAKQVAVPASRSTETYPFPSPTATVSASPAGNGIVWVLDNSLNGTDSGGPVTGAAVLRAYDATDLSRTLYSSTARAADAAGTAVKFTVPVIANGHVYVAGGGQVTVYGLAP